MDERSIKRLGVMVVTAIVIILVLKHVGLKMATNARLAHQQQAPAHQVEAPASTPAEAAPPQTSDETGALTAPPTDDAGMASAPAAAPVPADAARMPQAASAPDASPPAADPTLSTPPASLNAN